MFILIHSRLKHHLVQFFRQLMTTLQVLFYLLIFSHLTFIPYVYAGPTGGVVVGGAGSISQSGLTTTVNQTTGSMAIDWASYNLNSNERVQYNMDVSAISLNNILSNNGSQIHGRIDAAGTVILVNPNGIFFGPTSQINVGGLIASGLRISPTDFMNGNYIFNEVLGTDGAVINSGLINASLGGFGGGNVTLIGKQVKNEGVINAHLGAVNMAAGKQAVLTFDNQGLIGVKISKEILQDELGIDPALINSGEINAESGRVLLTASVSRDVFSQAVNTGDIEQARSVLVNDDGSFSLSGGADVVNSGSINVSATTENAKAGDVVILGENVTHTGMIVANTDSGTAGNIELHANDFVELKDTAIISARAETSGTGGKVKVLGNKVGLLDKSVVDVSGANGGGEALIGGDRQGLNAKVRNADFFYLSGNAKVFSDALTQGNGGRIITYANDTGRFYGNFYARGGTEGGDGGFIETSGKKGFEILNAPDVSARAGEGGLWLIDPFSITISATGTPASYDTSGRLYTANTDGAIIGVDVIKAALTGGNVDIWTDDGATSSTDPNGGDIKFDAMLDIDGIGSRTLQLYAWDEIIFEAGSKIEDDILTSTDSLQVELFANRDRASGTIGSGSGTGSITLGDNVSINTYGSDFYAEGIDFTSSATSTINVGTTATIDLDNISGDVTLGNLTANGGSDLSIKGANNITQQTGSVINVSQDTFLGDSSTTTVSLDKSAFNTFLRNTTLNADLATITASGRVRLVAGSNINDALTITNTGDIDATGAISVSNGTNALAIFNTTGNVTFDSDNNFNRVSIVNANTASLKDTVGNIELSANSGSDLGGITGDLIVVASGGDSEITDFGEINVGGTTSLSVDDNGSVILDNIANTLTGNITLKVLPCSGCTPNFGNVTLFNTAEIKINDIDVTNNLILTGKTINFGQGSKGTTTAASLTATATSAVVGNVITQSDALDISGLTTLSASASGNILLADGTNNFGTVTTNSANDLRLADKDSIVLGNTTTTGALTVTSGDGDNFSITQSTGSVLNIAGNAEFYSADNLAGGNNSGNNVTLANTGNIFGGNITATADRVGITDSTALELGQLTIDGSSGSAQASIFKSTGGDIKQTAGTFIKNDNAGAITRFDSGLNNLVVAEASNDFAVVEILNANNVNLKEFDQLQFGASTVSGTLDVTAGTDILQSGKVTVVGNTTLTATNGNITLADNNNDFNTVSVNTIASNKNVILHDSNSIGLGVSTVTGTLSIEAGNAATVDSITNPGPLSVAGTADFKVGNGDSIDLSNVANSFATDPTFSALTGRVANIAVTDITDIILQDGLNITGSLDVVATNISLQDTSVGGNLTLTANEMTVVVAPAIPELKGIIDQTGVLDVTGVSTLSAKTITLDDGSNDFQGNVVVNNAITDVTLVDGVGGITLGNALNPFVSKSLTVVSTGGDIAQGNSITTGVASFDSSNDVLLGNSLNNFSDTIAIVATRDAAITDSTFLKLSSATVGRDLNLESTTAGVELAGAVTVGRDMDIIAAGAITDAPGTDIAVTGMTSLFAEALSVAQDITLDSTASDYNNIHVLRGNNVVLVDNMDSVAVMGDVSGFLNLTENGTGAANAITNAGVLNVTGAATFRVAVGESINLDNMANTFDDAVRFNGVAGDIANLTIRDDSALTLQDGLTLSGDLVATASDLTFQTTTVTGSITASSTSGLINQVSGTDIIVVGTADFNGAGGIELANVNNDFQDMVTLTTTSAGNTSDAKITDDVDGLLIGQSSIDGSLTVTANSVTQDTTAGNGITVANSSLFTVNNGSSIELANTDNQFNSIAFSAKTSGAFLGSVTISNTGSLDLQGLSLTGDLIATSASGNITDSGALIVQGLTQLEANNITLDEAANNFTDITIGSVATVATAAAVAITDANALNFVGTSKMGSLVVKATTGNITDAAGASLEVANNTSLTTSNGSIILDNGNHDFNSLQLNSTGSTTITDLNAIDINNSIIAGNLTVTADTSDSGINNITSTTGGITVNGITSLTSSEGADVLLATGASHTLRGPVSLVGSAGARLNNVELNNSVDTNLRDITATTLLVNSGGNITDSGTIDLIGATTLSSVSDITLDSSTNDLNSIAVTTANNVNVSSVGALQLDSINMNGQLTVSANGITTTNDLLANTGMDLNAGTGTLAINNNITTNSGALVLTAGQDITQAATTTISGTSISVTSTGGDFNQNGNINNTAGNLTMDIAQSLTMAANTSTESSAGSATINAGNATLASLSANGVVDITTTRGGITQNDQIQSETASVGLNSSQSIVMAAAASTQAVGDIAYTSAGDQAIASLTSTSGSVSSISNNGAITDANAGNVNYTASKVVMRANSGIGSGDAIETLTAQLDVINNGAGSSQVNMRNTGDVLLTNLVNSGNIDFSNDTNVTIDHVDAGFTVGTVRLNVTNGSVFGVNRGGVDFFSVPDITADAAFVTVNGEFGTFERPIVLRLNSEFFLASTISSTFFLGGPPPVVNDTSDLQLSVFDSLNSVSGQQLIEIESLADIDPAIFTELHNYNQKNISIRLPRDQMFDDELENYDRL